jgi:phage portal protein BeeE
MALPVPVQALLPRALAALRVLGRLPFGSGRGARLADADGNSPIYLAGLLPGTGFDYAAAAGNAWENSAVWACLSFIGENFPEAPTVVREKAADGVWAPVDGHALPEFLDSNPFYDAAALWAALAMDESASGNAFLYLARDGAGHYREPWYLPSWAMRPVTPDDPGDTRFLLGWEYASPAGPRFLRPDQVVHFRFGIDPWAPQLGLGRLRPCLMEVATDQQASRWTAALMRNMAIPGMLIVPGDRELRIPDDEAERMERKILARYSGEGRGKPWFASRMVKSERLMLSPQELGIEQLRKVPEARVCAALRLTPMAVGLGVMDGGAFSNWGEARKEARRGAYEDCLQPKAKRFDRALDRQLLPRLVGKEQATVQRCGRDWSEVAAMQEDRSAVFGQNERGGGWMTINEARARVGLPARPDGDAYLPVRGRQFGENAHAAGV